MIRIFLGNIGSGKTISAVREMFFNEAKIPFYTNIQTNMNHCHMLKPYMIATKELVKETKTGDKKYKYNVNKDFWINLKKPVSVVLDECHSMLNSRKSMSSQNTVLNDWLSLIRRVVGESSTQQGEITFITQLVNRIDLVAREMATNIRYHICHYYKTCLKCGTSYYETSESPELLKSCPRCHHHELYKHSHSIEVYHFANLSKYEGWKVWGIPNTYHMHYMIDDAEKYFPLYNTLQWDNLLEEL